MKLTGSAHYSLFLLSSILGVASADNSHLRDDAPCVARSPTSGMYFDLSVISLAPPELKNGKQVNKDDRGESWHAKGHDYLANFTLNICAPVIEKVEDVVGVEPSLWKNVSAFYERDGKTYSIGYGGSDILGFPMLTPLALTDSKLQIPSSGAVSSSSITRKAPRAPTTITPPARTGPSEENPPSCPSSAIAMLYRTRPPPPSSVPWTLAPTTSRCAALLPVAELRSIRTPVGWDQVGSLV